MLPFIGVRHREAARRRRRVPGRVVARRPAAKRPLTTAAGDLAGSTARLRGLAAQPRGGLLLGAGPRALLLQLAHPLVAEGVGQHSDFRADPWGAARRDAPVVPPDRLRDHGRRHARRSARLNRLQPRHRACRDDARPRPTVPRTGARPGALAVGPRHARRVDPRVADRWREPLAAATAGPLLRGDAAGRARCSACRTTCCRGTSRRSTRTSPGCSRPAARSTRPTPRARSRRRSCGRRSTASSQPAGGLLAARPIARRVLGLVPRPAVDLLMLPAVGLLPAPPAPSTASPGARGSAREAWLVAAGGSGSAAAAVAPLVPPGAGRRRAHGIASQRDDPSPRPPDRWDPPRTAATISRAAATAVTRLRRLRGWPSPAAERPTRRAWATRSSWSTSSEGDRGPWSEAGAVQLLTPKADDASSRPAQRLVGRRGERGDGSPCLGRHQARGERRPRSTATTIRSLTGGPGGRVPAALAGGAGASMTPRRRTTNRRWSATHRGAPPVRRPMRRRHETAGEESTLHR